MKWILPILFLLAFSTSNGQPKDSLVYFQKSDAIKIANKIKLLQDTIAWQKEYITWQATIITEQDTLIAQQTQRFSIYEDQLKNRQQVIDVLEKENTVLRETITIMQPKWYNNKWLWFVGGVATTSILASIF